MRFGTWNVGSLYRAGSVMTVAKEVSKYKLDLVAVQEIRWDRGGTEPTGQYPFFYGKGNWNHESGIGSMCT
jgi:exonuclease III